MEPPTLGAPSSPRTGPGALRRWRPFVAVGLAVWLAVVVVGSIGDSGDPDPREAATRDTREHATLWVGRPDGSASAELDVRASSEGQVFVVSRDP